MRTPPTFDHEDALSAEAGIPVASVPVASVPVAGVPVAGVDEVGRGPWAGPVVACAVVLDRTRLPGGLADSKKLSPARREALSDAILRDHAVGIGACSVEEIDETGVGRATLLAMRRAVLALPERPAAALIDGTQAPDLPGVTSRTLPRADAVSASVAAASIVAKVHRDAVMARLAEEHPGYAWERNKGYGTADHAAGLRAHGVTPHHRRSFAPIARALSRTGTA